MKWSNQTRKVAELVPAEYNPRRLTKDQAENLKKSIQKFGEVDPVVINANNHVIGGHQRLKIYADLGIQEIDVRVPDVPLSEAEEKELNVRLNKNLGEWDWDTLANNFDNADLLDWGFTEKDLGLSLGKDDSELTDSLDSYLSGSIKQIVIYLDG